MMTMTEGEDGVKEGGKETLVPGMLPNLSCRARLTLAWMCELAEDGDGGVPRQAWL